MRRLRTAIGRGTWIRAAVLSCLVHAAASAQTSGPVVERVTLDEAVRRALERNPSVAQAAAGILRAEALLQQTRSFSRPSLGASVSSNTVAPVAEFEGVTITPRTQVTSALSLAVPILAPVQWAQKNQATDQVSIAQQNVEEVRRQVAFATADAYLRVIALKRVVDLNVLARDTAQAHFDYARQRFEGGVGSRLNMLRAEQEVSTDETIVEAAQLGVRRAQEALGVLIAADGPVDAAEEPTFETPPEASDADAVASRPDMRLVALRQTAAERVVKDSWRERLPSVTGFFDPQIVAPSGLFAEPRSVSARVVLQVPLFDSGDRTARRRQREAELTVVRAEREILERQARSDVRAARESVMSTTRAVASAHRAAGQAAEVVRITDVAFRAGATTNIEVIDAQRLARDTDTAAAIADDAARRASLELLVALGLFPR